MQYAAGLVLLMIIVLVYVLVRKRTDRSIVPQDSTHNVISMDKHRKSKDKIGDQPCSSCKKKNGKLIFYAQDNGTVVGLCKDCRVKAKKRDMLPL